MGGITQSTALLSLLVVAALSRSTSAQAAEDAPSCNATQVTHFDGVVSQSFRLESGQRIVVHSCQPGRTELRGVGYHMCVNGSWLNGHLTPRCESTDACPVPAPIANGAINVANPIALSDRITLACNDGLVLINRRTATCTVNGWSLPPAEIGECVSTCPLPRVSAPVTYTSSSEEVAPGEVAVGAELTFRCDRPGTKINGAATSVCGESGWRSPPPTCKDRTCKLNALLSDGTLTNRRVILTPSDLTLTSRFTYGQTVTLVCKSARKYLIPEEASNFTCAADETKSGNRVVWKYTNSEQRVEGIVDATCIAYCDTTNIHVDPHTLAPPETLNETSLLKLGQTVVYTCPEGRIRDVSGHTLHPGDSRKAVFICAESQQWQLSDGRLFRPMLRCEATHCPWLANIDPQLQVVASGKALDPQPIPRLGRVEFSCNLQDEIVGNRSARCVPSSNSNHLQWSNVWPTCRRVERLCPDLPNIEHGHFISSIGGGPPFSPDVSVGLQCNRCFRPSDRVATSCSANATRLPTWSVDIRATHCVEIECPALTGVLVNGATPSPAVRYACGQVVTISCNHSYSVVGDTRLECMPNGRWSGCKPLCVRNECNGSRCTGHWQQQCTLGNGTAQICSCVPEPQCPRCPEQQPVCGADARTYTSPCHMRASQCAGKTEAYPHVNGACKDGGLCHQPKPSRPQGQNCAAGRQRWYYDKTLGRCSAYYHGSCYVGQNSFVTPTECRQQCERAPDPCRQPPAEDGPCLVALERYTYNPLFGRCERFDYGGCGGNSNNFLTDDACQRACGTSASNTYPVPACRGVQCPNATMATACPPHDTHIFVMISRISIQPTGGSFGAVPDRFLYKTDDIAHISGTFVYYQLMRDGDNAESGCACPDIAAGKYLIIGRVGRTARGHVRLAITSSSYVEQYVPGRDAEYQARVDAACPHLRHLRRQGGERH